MMVDHDAAASVLTRLDAQWSPFRAAREFAAAELPVFPIEPDGKRPLTSRGFLSATADPGTVDRWWRLFPSANIAIPTGAVSGFVVVDVDVHHVDGRPAFARTQASGLTEGWMFLVATPSGGTHAYYPSTPGEVQPCWQAARAGIDFRGDGGYVVVPPSSLIVDGAPQKYRVVAANPGPASTIDARQLRDVLDPRTAPQAGSASAGVAPGVDAERLAAWVSRRVEGERNRGLFWAACRLAETGLPLGSATEALAAAAGDAGLNDREISTTIQSAYRTVTASARRSLPATTARSPVSSFSDEKVRRDAESSPVRGMG